MSLLKERCVHINKPCYFKYTILYNPYKQYLSYSDHTQGGVVLPGHDPQNVMQVVFSCETRESRDQNILDLEPSKWGEVKTELWKCFVSCAVLCGDTAEVFRLLKVGASLLWSVRLQQDGPRTLQQLDEASTVCSIADTELSDHFTVRWRAQFQLL